MLHAKLAREGFGVNVKVVERIYREERLWLRRTKRKKIPREGREGAWCPIATNQRWSLDFTSDALANGRKFRTANLKDDCTRECPAIEVDFSLPGERVVDMLERVARERGYTAPAACCPATYPASPALRRSGAARTAAGIWAADPLLTY